MKGKLKTLFLVAAIMLLAVGCESKTDAAAPQTKSDPVAKQDEKPARNPAFDKAAPKIDARRAMRYVKEVVGFGPRTPGSAGHAKVGPWLKKNLGPVQLEDDPFTAQTPKGPIAMKNFIAKFPGKREGVIVIGGHYDTNFGISGYVGANDGGSSTALLLELAHHLRTWGNEGYDVWLVWFDGEEAVEQWSATDSTYGSRHLADKWSKEGTLKKIKALMIVDMIGDKDLNIEGDTNSTRWLMELIGEAARNLEHESYFFGRMNAIDDDHMPFIRKGVPAADIIDLDYGYANALHHTKEDTLDQVSPRSLEIVGNTVLETVRLLNQR